MLHLFRRNSVISAGPLHLDVVAHCSQDQGIHESLEIKKDMAGIDKDQADTRVASVFWRVQTTHGPVEETGLCCLLGLVLSQR